MKVNYQQEKSNILINIKNLKKTHMKIELKYDGKNYYDPLFTFFWNDEKDNFKIGIKFSEIIDYTFMREDLLNHYEIFKINGTSLYYYTKENVYVFNLEDSFNLIPIDKMFFHSIVLLDKNDKIIENQYKSFKCTIYGNNN